MIERAFRNGVITGLVTAGLTVVSTNVGRAEPSPHYADAPRVLPAPISYGRPQHAPAEKITYTTPSSYTSYQRVYATPDRRNGAEVRNERVVYTTAVVREPRPVVVPRVYHEPRRVLHINTGPHYVPRRVYRYYRPNRYVRHPVPRLVRPHWPACRPVRRLHHARHHYRPRGWGVSFGGGRGPGGHRHGGFSFYLNR